jgi:hypothetical protein
MVQVFGTVSEFARFRAIQSASKGDPTVFLENQGLVLIALGLLLDADSHPPSVDAKDQGSRTARGLAPPFGGRGGPKGL